MPETQIKEIYEEAREHNTAHAQVAARDSRRASWFAILAAVLAVFSGASWTKLGGSILSDQTAQLVAAVTAFLAAIVSGIVAATHWSADVTAHTQAAGRWGVVRGDIEFARLLGHGNGGQQLTQDEIDKLMKDRGHAQEDEPVLSKADLKRATTWLHTYRPEVYN